MKSRDKLLVSVEPVLTEDGYKPWARIRVLYPEDGSIVPSFEDLFQMVHAIVHCERAKYAGRVKRPSEKVRRFLCRMIDASDALCDRHESWPVPDTSHDSVWLKLAAEFQIPIRDARKAKEPRAPPQPGTVTPLPAALTVEELEEMWGMSSK